MRWVLRRSGRDEKGSDVTARTAGVEGEEGAVFGVRNALANFNRRKLLTCYSPPPVVVLG
jgi:hypothetical protein